MTKHAYVFDNDPQELRRLILQAAVLRPVTERLLRVAQLGKGMHVLDLGCGAGDVSLLAADIVGPTGSVTAIDRDERALAIASERAASRRSTSSSRRSRNSRHRKHSTSPSADMS